MASKKDNFTEIHVQMDNLVEDFKSITEQIESFMQIRDRKIKAVNEQCEEKVAPLNKELEYIKAQLRVLADQVPQKEAKTKSKVELLSGSVVIKKPTQTLVADKDKLIEWAKENAMNDYIDEKVVQSFKWKELKADLDIVDGQVVNKITGEIMAEGVTIEDKPEEVVIK